MTRTPIELLVAVAAMALATVLTRAAPFFLFMKRDPPPWVGFAQKYIPPVMMCLLVVSALSSIEFERQPYGLPELVSVAVVAVLHFWKRNALLSILGGTGLYMLLVRLLPLG